MSGHTGSQQHNNNSNSGSNRDSRHSTLLRVEDGVAPYHDNGSNINMGSRMVMERPVTATANSRRLSQPQDRYHY